MQRFWGMGTTAKFPFTLKTIQGRKRWKQPFGRTVQNSFVLKEVFGFLSLELLKLNTRTIKALLVILLFLGGAKVFAQNHVNWTVSFNAPTSEIYVKGDIEEHWHLYSNKTPQNAGPVPIEIHLAKSKAYRIKKDFSEQSIPAEVFDPNFESTVFVFENEFESTAKIKIRSKRNVTFEGVITYMVCNETMCLPPIDKPFKIDLK